VCVEDCSNDKTFNVLETYRLKFPNKITVLRNEKNIGAGLSRNKGVVETQEKIPSEYLWIVDGDDYLADRDVLKDLHDFTSKNQNYDIVNIGITYSGKYSVGKAGWPIASWGRIIRPKVYVKSPDRNIPYGNDVYSHFVMFDQVDDSKIGTFDRKCYVCPGAGRHRNNTEKNMNVMKTVGEYLMRYEFKKKSVVDAMKTSETGVWNSLKRGNQQFNPKLRRGVSILMASFPFRKKWMLQCIERLIGQCDNFYLWLNEYKEIPEELKKFD
jgi:glycosyltransferase involved in cell wall biosynthesis